MSPQERQVDPYRTKLLDHFPALLNMNVKRELWSTIRGIDSS